MGGEKPERNGIAAEEAARKVHPLEDPVLVLRSLLGHNLRDTIINTNTHANVSGAQPARWTAAMYSPSRRQGNIREGKRYLARPFV